MRPRRLPRLLAPALALALGGPASTAGDEAPARPPIYKWVDANGIAHYTTDPDRIPAELRGLVREGRGDAAPPSPGAPESAADAWAARDAPPAPVETAPPEAAGAPGPDARRVHAAVDTRELDGRIAALEEEIARDEERITTWVSDPAVDPMTLADDPEFRELAARLPRLQADLRSLREQKQGGQEP